MKKQKTPKTQNLTKYKFGGGFDAKDKTNVRNFFGNYAKAGLDTVANIAGIDAVGAGKGIEYKGNSANKFNQITNVTGAIAKTAAPIAANLVVPGSGNMVSAGQQVAGGAYNQFGPQNEQGYNAYDSQGNPIYNEGDKSGQIGNMAGQAGSIAGGFMGSQKQQVPEAKYGGQMKYPNGGQTTTPNAEIELQEGTKDGLSIREHDLNSHANATSENQKNLNDGTKILSTKLKNPLTGRPFSDAVIDTKKFEKTINDRNASSTSKLSANLNLQAANSIFNREYNIQEMFKKAQAEKGVSRLEKKWGVNLSRPSQDNEQMEPQGMSEQSEGEFAMGGMKKYPIGGPVDGTNTTNQTMTPLQWAQFNKSKNYTISPAANHNGYNDYYDSSKYNPVKGNNNSYDWFKNGDEGKIVNYTNDKTYTPFESYGGQRIANTLPQWNTTTILRNGQHQRGYLDGHTELVGQPRPINTVPVSGFANGGKFNLPKYAVAGIFNNNEEENNVGLSTDSDEEISLNNDAIDRNHGFGKYSANKYGKFSRQEKPEGFDWNELGRQALSFGANNAGNIYDLNRANKVETRNYNRVNANTLDNTAAMRDADSQTRRAEYNVRGASGGNAGTYLSNRVALNTENTINKDRIRQEYANANAGILNHNSEINTGISNEEILANAKIRANARNTKQSAIASIGSNSANQMNDIANSRMDKKKMDGFVKMYPSLAKDPKMLEYFMSFNK